ncbi:hypothetical protein [Clostridium sp.]|uniref:hypothetical protein n=1 Tax=Clostridium sp. TaxID=1506 RepID=UPI002A91259F|nr:hypothetical protein [Clostridium sp.]MDY6012312.1 hypothetical protein [Clostridium sp.]
MGLKDKFDKYFRDSYFQKYGDRITSAQGTVMSVKTEEKNYVIFHKLIVNIIIKPDAGRSAIKCRYKRNRWFKKPEFIQLNKGHKVIIMGLKGVKGKKDSEIIQIQNILNLTTKKDLVPIDHSQIKKARQTATRMRQR